MKILNIRAKGFIGFKKGMGVDEINLDLSDLDGLVAITGENGFGKTTLIELLSPFRQLFSRDTSLKNHVFLRDSEKELCFLLGGNEYRTLIKIDGQSDRSEGFIWKDGVPQVNGKVREYDRYIGELLGTVNLFANSVFCAQNSKKLSDMRPGQVKELFAEFLRLDRLTAWESTAKHCAAMVAGQLSDVGIEIDTLNRQISELPLEYEMAAVEQESTETVALQMRLKDSLAPITSDIENAKKIAAGNGANRKRRDEALEVLGRLNTDMVSSTSRMDAEIEGLKAKILAGQKIISGYDETLARRKDIAEASSRLIEITSQSADIERQIADRLPGIEKLKESINTMDSDKGKLQRDADELKRHDQVLASLSAEKITIENAIKAAENEFRMLDLDPGKNAYSDKIKAARDKIRDIEQSIQIAGMNPALQAIKSRIESCRGKMADLNKRDPECQSKTCSFITGAMTAAEELPAFEAELAGKNTEIQKQVERYMEDIATTRSNISILESGLAEYMLGLAGKGDNLRNKIQRQREKLSEIDGKIKTRNSEILAIFARINSQASAIDSELITTKAQIQGLMGANDDAKRKLAALKAESGKNTDIASKQTEIEIAEARKTDLEKQLAELAETLMAKRTDRQTYSEKALSEINRQKALVSGIVVDNQIESKLSELEKKKEATIADLNKAENQLRLVIAKRQALEIQFAKKREAKTKLKQLTTESGALSAELSEWKYLQDACSKTGLQALEIDAVAPMITGYTNELLGMTFGPNHTVSFRTLSDDGREVLDILVIGEDGSETLLENLSGGQKVWILKALRLAMTRISQEKSGRHYSTLFCDEEDGPLNPENAVRFTQLYRSTMKAGDIPICYFVSHKPEAVAMADHRIEFSRSGITIN